MIALAPAVVLGERYRLEHWIAGGGMGEVWAARDMVLERMVAVKVLRPEFAEDPTFRTRVLAEARHAALLSHPGIAGVFDFGEADGTPYIVMELVDGETLAALLARTGALPVGQALSIVGQAALALQAAHDAGVVHRDVKPGNFIVRPDGVVKVTDFGIARALAGASITMTGNVLGTVHYIAPEQARGERVTPASDTYALGVVAWECLEGKRPFAYDSPLAVATAHASEPLPPMSDRIPAEVR
ncbi:MAG: eukaryotic-like serine/threonine-protein kinase, partial [Frankiaceae bacterium]|nr:eukaryotic-like serine/threonine-protein kinase [Frankiaceae bacterium]